MRTIWSTDTDKLREWLTRLIEAIVWVGVYLHCFHNAVAKLVDID